MNKDLLFKGRCSESRLVWRR